VAAEIAVQARTPESGEMVAVVVDGTLVTVANVDGTLYAFDDTCTHRACPLSEGQLEGLTVVCPCHKSRFSLETGEPRNGPAQFPIRIRRIRHDGKNLMVER